MSGCSKLCVTAPASTSPGYHHDLISLHDFPDELSSFGVVHLSTERHR